MVHLSGEGRGEHVGAVRVLGVLLDQQVYRRLRNGHQPYGVLRLGSGQFQGAVRVADVLLAHGNRPLLDVQVIPPQGYQFPLPQAADQLQVEHGEQASGLCRVQIGFHIFWRKDLHLQREG